MKKINLINLIMMFLTAQTAYGAMTVEGAVTRLDVKTNTFTLMKADSEAASGERLEVSVLPEVQYRGLDGFTDLNVGDLIRAEVSQGQTVGKWDASVVELIQKEPAELVSPRAGEMTKDPNEIKEGTIPYSDTVIPNEGK